MRKAPLIVVAVAFFAFGPLLTRAVDEALTDRLEGYILLQVEEHGEAWYVNPDDGLRYYMKDGDVAYEIMRSFSLGITNADLATIPQVQTTAEMDASTLACTPGSIQERLRGKILLQVEAHGEAYYVDPDKCRAIYMEDGDAAYSIMRYLSLGITNADLALIAEGTIEGFVTENPCEPGYILGADVYCHPECGDSGTYCTGDAQCLNGACVTCDSGYYLATDGYCYPLDSSLTCDDGYILGSDDLCHPECGNSGTYCTDDATCFEGECFVCEEGYYLASDGYCYPYAGGSYTCDSGYVLGDDGYCYPECGDGYYCTGGAECFQGECVACDSGYYLGVDGYCYAEYDDGGYYSCDPGYVLGDDGYCYPECGEGYYCTGDSQCFNEQCLTCQDGYYLGSDGRCYPEDEGAYYSCDPGYVLGDDGYCYPECGDGYYCTGDAECFNGQCVSCDSGYYLGTDGRCYPESGGDYNSCYPGYVYGDDGLCHEECGSGYYCTGSSICYYGQCVTCPPGYYLGTDGYCYSY